MDDKSQKSLYRERKKSMSTILEMLHNYTAENPNVPILFDDAHSKGITYTQFDEMTGKVCAWLREQGIGKEDFVLINLPRGVFPVIAMVGVWKAGAAWALVEDTYAPDRIDYIRRDCKCVAELNKDNWENVMHMKPFAGFVTADDHDAAYAIYTSGTTGNPKGVLHEYGNLERAIESIRLNGETPFYSKDRLALLAPMNCGVCHCDPQSAEHTLQQNVCRALHGDQEPGEDDEVLPREKDHDHLPHAVLCQEDR